MDGAWKLKVGIKPTVAKVRIWDFSGVPDGNRNSELSRLIRANTANNIACLPHHPVSWFQRGQYLAELGFIDLAAGDCFKAIALANAALDKNPETIVFGELVRIEIAMSLWFLNNPKFRRMTTQSLNDEVDRMLSQARLGGYSTLTGIMFDMVAYWDVVNMGVETVEKALARPPVDSKEGAMFLSLAERPAQAAERLREGIPRLRNLMETPFALIEGIRVGYTYGRPWPWMKISHIRRSKKLTEEINKEMLIASDGMLEVRYSRVKDSAQYISTSNDNPSKSKSQTQDVLGVFTTRDIFDGETALIDRTLIAALDYDKKSHPEPHCNHCLQLSSCPVHCTTCDTAYCSKECKNLARHVYHKVLCGKDFTFLHAYGQPDESQYAFLLLRILAMCVQSNTHPLEHPLIARLTASYEGDHLEAWSLPSYILKPHQILEKLGVDPYTDPRFDTWVIRTIMSRLLTNLCSSKRFAALRPLYSMMNHSCRPSLEYLEDVGMPGNGTNLALLASRDIRKGEEVFVSYIDIERYKTREERRKKLFPWFGGDCACERCVEEELGLD
ncbi:MAG: hypothetical protein MMC33_001932 [Icmadophila ericetorum]|nr:hypothetical protein [Icmadophila ericetorum]